MHPKVVEYEKTRQLPDIENIKAASNQAEYKTLSALAVLRASYASNFSDVSGFWISRLMHSHCIYQEKLTGQYFISFGVYGDAGLFWEVKAFGEGDSFFALSSADLGRREAALQIQFFCTQNLWHPGMMENEEEYEGVPTEVCYLNQIKHE